MSRSRRLAVDDNNTWLLRATYSANSSDGPDGTVDHATDDYVYIANDGSGDDSGSFSAGMYTAPGTLQGNFTVWGKGVISLGAPTQAQIDFMAAADSTTDLKLFPGAYIELGYHDPATTDIVVNIRNPQSYGYYNAYTEVTVGGTVVTIYSDHIAISGGAAVIDLGTGVQGTFDGTTGSYRLASLILTNGTAGDDVITPTDAPQTIHGLAGNDTLTAGKNGSDLYGDDGNDTLTGGLGSDHLFGGNGNDTLKGGNGDLLDGGAGNDTLFGERGSTISGGDGIDRMVLDFTGLGLWFNVALADGADGSIASIGTSYTGIEKIDLIGGYGNDTLSGNSGANTIDGGAGADIIDGGAGNDTLDAGIGAAAPEFQITDFSISFDGAPALDAAFNARSGADPQAVIEFNESTFTTFDGFYRVNVGEGGHLVVDSSSSLPVSPDFSVNLYDAGFNLFTHNDIGLALDVSNLPAGTYYIEIATGSTASFNHVSQAVVSLSTATPANRHNVLSGGTGNDTFLVHQADDVVIEKPGEGTDLVIADLSWTLGANLENLTLKAGAGAINGAGNTLANTITGNESANVLNGGSGNDVLIGGGGNDLLRGDGGADRMEGGTGNDAYRVDNSGDLVVEKPGEGIDKVFASVDYTLTDNVETLVLTGTAPLKGTGNALANSITGNGGANVLNGGAGIDTMLGGAGDDIYYVDNRSDRVYETLTARSTVDAGGTDKVIATTTYSLDAPGRQFVENLTLAGTAAINGTGNALANRIDGNNAANILTGGDGNDTLVGYNGDDRLYGGSGNDVLIAGAGNDKLDPGSGQDTMTGAGGADIFIFTTAAVADATTMASADRITDFSHAERDRIDLRQIDANPLLAGDQAFTFIGTAAFSGHAGELRVLQTSSATFLVGDLNGDGIGDGYIRLSAGLTLVVGDFLL